MNKVNVSENTKPKKLSKITFGLMSGKDMAACAEFETSSNELYKMPARTPAPNGVLDLRLGVSDKKTACATCGEKLAECIGHFGHIKMHIPVYHIGFFKHTIQILQAICKRCSRVLLTPEERDVALRRMTTAEGALRRLQHLKKVLDRAKKFSCCPYCEAFNGVVKKVVGVGTLKIVHERYKGKKRQAVEDRADFLDEFDEAKKANPDLETYLGKCQDDLSPSRVRRRISIYYSVWRNMYTDT